MTCQIHAELNMLQGGGKTMRQSGHEKTVLDGNAFYELDLDCFSEKRRKLPEHEQRKSEIGQKRIDNRKGRGVK